MKGTCLPLHCIENVETWKLTALQLHMLRQPKCSLTSGYWERSQPPFTPSVPLTRVLKASTENGNSKRESHLFFFTLTKDTEIYHKKFNSTLSVIAKTESSKCHPPMSCKCSRQRNITYPFKYRNRFSKYRKLSTIHSV